MKVYGVALLLAVAARGLVARGRSESPSERLHAPCTYGRHDFGLTRALRCRGGGSATAAPRRAGSTRCLGERSGGSVGLQARGDADKPWGARQGWGQLRRSPAAAEARTSSTEKLAQRGGATAAASAGVSKQAYKRALLRTSLLVCSAGAFGLGTWVVKGKTSALEFFAGYIVEQSLSVDNLFIFIMLFDYFKVPEQFQSRVLNWGIIGAVSMRAVMIVGGVAAIQRFRAVMLVFAGILVVSSIKLLMEGVEDEHDSSALEGNTVLKIANWMMDSVDYYDGEKFFTLVKGVKKATPLLLCLVCIELTDFVFAVDSIPAVLAISHDTLVVYASNVFAICAMRSIYTLVSHAISDLPYLKPAVALVLGFVGGKMFAEFFHYDISVGVSLSVVCGLLGLGAIASIISNSRRDAALAAGASSVTGGGSSGLTFDAYSAAAAASGSVGEETTAPSPTASVAAMEEGGSALAEKLASDGYQAADAGEAVGDAAEAAADATEGAADAAGAATSGTVAAGEEEGAVLGDHAESIAEDFLRGVEDVAEVAKAQVEEELAEGPEGNRVEDRVAPVEEVGDVGDALEMDEDDA